MVRSATFASIMSFQVLPTGFPLAFSAHDRFHTLELNSLMAVICIQVIFSSVLYENTKLSKFVSKLPERRTEAQYGQGKWSWAFQVVLRVYDISEPRHRACQQNHQFIVGWHHLPAYWSLNAISMKHKDWAMLAWKGPSVEVLLKNPARPKHDRSSSELQLTKWTQDSLHPTGKHRKFYSYSIGDPRAARSVALGGLIWLEGPLLHR